LTSFLAGGLQLESPLPVVRDSSSTDGVTHSLVQLEYLLLDLAGAPAVGRPYLAGTASVHPAPPGHRSLVASGFHPDREICDNPSGQ
jgi:hypothetical protein